MVLDIEDYAGISDFFAGFAVERISAVTNGSLTNGIAEH
jgi:phenol 2-monooxygenase